MSTPVDELLDEALKLSAADRARVAAELLASLDGETEADIEAAWNSEVAARAAQVERGEAKLLDWDSVKAEIETKLRSR